METLVGHLAGDLDFGKLPLTFRHAITVTLLLGIKYLWIDSLCIIQDSTSDWEAESAKMGDYYVLAQLVTCWSCGFEQPEWRDVQSLSAAFHSTPLPRRGRHCKYSV